MKKRLLALLLCAVMVCAVFVQAAPGVFAEGLAYMQCGKNLTAVLNLDTGVMTFEGTGEFYKNDADGDEFVYFSTWANELKEVAIPEGITYIPYSLFSGCFNLERVTLPSTLKTIGVWAFEYCDSLQRIAIPAKVSAIDSSAFSCCTGLMQIDVDPANRSYCSDADGALYTKDKATLVAFPGGRSGSYTVAAGTRTIASEAFSYSALSSITLPDRLSTIERNAFEYCSVLVGLVIPAGVTEIATPICSGCEKLSGIWVDVANKHYANDAVGVLYSKDFSALLECPRGLTGKYAVRDGTSRIEWSAFDGSALTEVALPDSVAVIDALAFYGCTGLNEIVIPAGVKEIGNMAFNDCENLKAVYFLGNAPETVGKKVFQMAYYDYATDTFSEFNIPGLTLYYLEGASGWTSPTWGADAYPTAVWKPSGYFDVKPGSWYEQSVQYATEHGLMNGTGTNTFEPESTMTRAMLVTVLWRYAGEPRRGSNRFSDVPSGEWYTQAVAWAAADGVVNGVGNRRFDPNGSVSREQMATILFRYAKKTGVNTESRADLSAFPDAGAVDRYASDAMQWAVGEGIIGGSREADGADWLKPLGDATRAQVAAILMRFIQNLEK